MGAQKFDKKDLKPGLDGVWTLIRMQKVFTLETLTAFVKCDRAAIKSYVRMLKKAGYLKQKTAKTPTLGVTFELVKDTGAIRPEFTTRGKLAKSSPHQRMWQALKVLKSFSVTDLMLSSRTTRKVTEEYVSWLFDAKYLEISVDWEKKGEREPRYHFRASKDTGWYSPIRKPVKFALYDRNTCKFVASMDGAANER